MAPQVVVVCSKHGWGDCKATTHCGLKFCQCARSMASCWLSCWVEADVMPTKDELKTAQGRNLKDRPGPERKQDAAVA
jgi:hypothetical protein